MDANTTPGEEELEKVSGGVVGEQDGSGIKENDKDPKEARRSEN